MLRADVNHSKAHLHYVASLKHPFIHGYAAFNDQKGREDKAAGAARFAISV